MTDMSASKSEEKPSPVAAEFTLLDRILGEQSEVIGILSKRLDPVLEAVCATKDCSEPTAETTVPLVGGLKAVRSRIQTSNDRLADLLNRLAL